MSFKNVGSMVAYPAADKNDNALVMISTEGIDVSHENQLYIHEPVQLPKYVDDDLHSFVVLDGKLFDELPLGLKLEIMIKRPHTVFGKKSFNWFKTIEDPEGTVVRAMVEGYEIEGEK